MAKLRVVRRHEKGNAQRKVIGLTMFEARLILKQLVMIAELTSPEMAPRQGQSDAQAQGAISDSIHDIAGNVSRCISRHMPEVVKTDQRKDDALWRIANRKSRVSKKKKAD